jgi:hypothetical protein
MAIGKLRFALLVPALLVGGAVGTGVSAQQTFSPQYASDRAEIEDLMGRYLFALDYNDIDAYMATFAPEAELEFASGTYKGHAAIQEAVSRFRNRITDNFKRADGSQGDLRHITLYNVMRVEGDRAWVRTQWMEMSNTGPQEAALKMLTFGVYEDEVSRINGRWLFTRRNVLNDFIKNRGTGPENPVTAMEKQVQAHLSK